MEITAHNLYKRFNREWVLKDFNYHFKPGGRYAVIGPNGSGKSTLLQIISGSMLYTKGDLSYQSSSGLVDHSLYYQFISLATPYLEHPEEMTFRELFGFHTKFKNLWGDIPFEKFAQETGLVNAVDKEIRNFSSGMKQKLKLSLAICTEAPVLLLDEPTTNLDKSAIAWYQAMVKNIPSDQMVIVCSNQPLEYEFCNEIINMEDYK